MDRQNLDKAFHASELIIQHLRSSIENESRELDSWIEESEQNRILFSELMDIEYLRKELLEFYQINAGKKGALRKIRRKMFMYEGDESTLPAVRRYIARVGRRSGKM